MPAMDVGRVSMPASWCACAATLARVALPTHHQAARLSSAPPIADTVADAEPLREARRELRIVRVLKGLAALLIATYFVVALGIVALRHLILPRIDEYRPQLAAALSRSLGQQVTIGHVAADWQGAHARIVVDELRLFDRQGRFALSLPRLEGAIGWRSALYGELRFSWLAIDGADVVVRRDAAHHIYVAGVLLGDNHDFVNWLLRQREVAVRGARVEWHDDLRGAAPLALDAVELHLVNRGRSHRFALRAQPPEALSSAIEVRGELRGRNFDQLADWNGRLYAELDRIDLAAWNAWIDPPLSVHRGSGGLRLWLGLKDGHLTEAVADVALADVAARLAADLPKLELDTLHGRIGVRGLQPGAGFLSFLRGRQPGKEIFGRDLAFGLRGEPALAPSDFTLRWEPRGEGSDGVGELRSASLELAPLAALAERLPLPLPVRQILKVSEPSGHLGDVVFKWQGPAEAPTRFGARGQFERLGVKPHGHAPGATGLAGSFELDESSGSVRLDAKQAALAWPSVLADATVERPIVLDSVGGRVAWTRQGDVLDVRWEDFAFSGPEVAGTSRGRWKTPATPDGGLELAIDGTRAEARAAYRFVPHLQGPAEEWLRTAIRAGSISDLKVRLKGDPHDFPFDDPARGDFEVTMKIAGGVLHFAPDWPPIEGIAGTFRFDRRKMEIGFTAGKTLGIALGPVQASMDRLIGGPHVLVVEGATEAPAAELLRYATSSPLAAMSGNGLAGIAVDGRAKLALRSELPLDHLDQSKVAGSVQLAGSNIVLKGDEPPLSQVAGTIAFNELGVSARNLTAQAFGGPVTISVATRDDRSIAFNAQGTASVAELTRRIDSPMAARVQGTTAYRVSGTVRGKATDLTVESNLQGVAIDLPAPFGKAAAESWPSRFERVVVFSGDGRDRQRRDTVVATLGSIANVKAVLRPDAGNELVLERMGIGVGDAQAVLPREPGITVNGRLAWLDVDQLLPLARDERAAGTGELRALDLKADELVVAGRRLHDVALVSQIDSRGWQAEVSAREVTGTVSYRSEGQGAVVARFKSLSIPPATSDPNPGRRTLQELPAVDIIAEDFRLGGHSLGRLEGTAVNARDEWRIERLDVVAPEGTTHLQGTWRPAGSAGQGTDVTFTIESGDVGGYLDRIGLPHTVARGSASLSGKVSWDGPVYAIDFPTLNGNAKVSASRGQFLRVKPGIGKLLGVLSMQALPRRITLDFRDVFSEGFAFDTLAATATISRGVLSTTDFLMIGPAASVTLRGTASLSDETQDLRVRVVPSVADNVAAAAGLALINPVVGLGALVAQRVLKEPIGQMLAYEYRVTGAWDDPKVERVARGSGPEMQSMAAPSEVTR